MNNHPDCSERGQSVCTLDPQRADDLILRSQTGELSPQEEADLERHLAECPRCKLDRELMDDLEMELLLAADDNRRLQQFDPDPEHAKKCVFVTTQRLERFARGLRDLEYITDEKLKEHLDVCPYCRRRSIVLFHEMQHAEHLPLVHRLTKQAVQDELTNTQELVWRAAREGARGPVVVDGGPDLSLVEGVTVSYDRDTLTVNVSGGLPVTVLIVARDQRERRSVLDAERVVRFDDVRTDEYYLWIEGGGGVLFLDLQDDNSTKDEVGLPPAGTGAREEKREAVAASIPVSVSALTGLLLGHAPAIRKRLEARIPARYRHVVSVDDIVHATFTDAFLEIEQVPRSEDAVGRWLWAFAKRHLVVVLRMLDDQVPFPTRGRLDRAAIEESYVRLCHQTETIPNHGATRSVRKTMIEDAMMRLPEEYREVITLYEDGNQRLDDIARATGRGLTATCLMLDRGYRLRAECATATTLLLRRPDEGQEQPAYFQGN